MAASTGSSEAKAGPRVLWISNGHGEDRIARVLMDQGPWRTWDHRGFPLVGEGHAYREAGVPIVAPLRAMPSGGFILRQRGAFATDVRNGLLGLLLQQLASVRPQAASADLIVAVGDLLPLAFAVYAGRPCVFVGCAKSDHYGQPGQEDYLPVERWFMRRNACLAVYPRDGLTAAGLVRRGIRAHDMGNPMMDDMVESGLGWPHDHPGPVLGILPGSRRDAPANLVPLLQAAVAFLQARSDAASWSVAVAVAPQVPLADLLAVARDAGWSPGPEGVCRAPGGQRLDWLIGRFGDWVGRVRLVFGMAGTAIEQCVGRGVPVVTFPGTGPQFNRAFAEAQARLLGDAVQLARHPDEAAALALRILADEALLARMRAVGAERMGPQGAAGRIAAHAAQLVRGVGRETST